MSDAERLDPGAVAAAAWPESSWACPGQCHLYVGQATVLPIAGDEAHHRARDLPPGGAVLDRKVEAYPTPEDA